MKRYDIRKTRKRAKGVRVALPAISESAGSKREYYRALRALMTALKAKSRQTKSQDGFFDLNRVANDLTRVAEQTVRRILNLESKRHTDTFIASAKRAIGVDLAAIVTQEDLIDHLKIVTERNALLIKGLSDDTVRKVQQEVLDTLLAGKPNAHLQERLSHLFKISDSRAQLIAQDQMAKLNSELNEIRHKQAGITHYTWLTSRDERVRARHRELDGKFYKYGEPTGAEGGLQPGRPIRCRCIAQAVVEF